MTKGRLTNQFFNAQRQMDVMGVGHGVLGVDVIDFKN